MDKICGIYCIENIINHKKYIGQSTDIKARFRKHKNYLRKGSHNNVHLQSSWNIYGENSFEFYVIEECLIEQLDEKEIYYIAKFQLMNDEFGYNIEPGGSQNKSMSKTTKKKISESLTGREFSEEHRKKIGKANANREVSDNTKQKMSKNHADISGVNNPMFGKHHSDETKIKISQNRNTLSGNDHPNYGKHLSDETKQKISSSHIGIFSGANHPRCRPVYCPELDMEFWGAAEAEEKLGINRTYIYACLSGKQKSAGKHPVTGDKLHWFDAKNTSTIQN